MSHSTWVSIHPGIQGNSCIMQAGLGQDCLTEQCQLPELRQEPRKDETPDMMEWAKKSQAKMRKAKREQAASTILLPARLL